jgi:glycosyltransferase involved in cell wall biosynthesis
MIDRPLVSVVLIFWNAAAFLREAIESVLAQSYPCRELLLVDDGSSDGSTEIARQYAAHHPGQVRYFEHAGHANLGMSASRNLGIRQAQGSYVAFLDADDMWFSSALEDQVAILQAHPAAAMVYGPIQWWYSWTGKPEDGGRDHVERLGVPADSVIDPPRLLPLFLRDKAAVPSGVLVRRGVVESVGGFEDQFRGEYEDQVFCAKICLEASVYAAGRCWYRYRQHPDSCVLRGQQTGETHAARLRFLNWLGEYLTERKVRDRAVWRALELELWRFRHPRRYLWLRRSENALGRMQRLLRRAGRGR